MDIRLVKLVLDFILLLLVLLLVLLLLIDILNSVTVNIFFKLFLSSSIYSLSQVNKEFSQATRHRHVNKVSIYLVDLKRIERRQLSLTSSSGGRPLKTSHIHAAAI